MYNRLAWAGCVAYPWSEAMREPEVGDGHKVKTPMPFLFPDLNITINAEC